MIYAPFQQDRGGFVRFVSFVARTATPASVADGVRAEIRRAAPDLPIESTVTMDEALAASVAQPRFRTVVLALFATAATLIATCGLYGLMAYAVTQRRREIGVRMALGATRRDVLRLVLTRALRIVVAGLIVGPGGGRRSDSCAANVPVRRDADRSDRVRPGHAAALGRGTAGGMAARAPRDPDRSRGRRCARSSRQGRRTAGTPCTEVKPVGMTEAADFDVVQEKRRLGSRLSSIAARRSATDCADTAVRPRRSVRRRGEEAMPVPARPAVRPPRRSEHCRSRTRPCPHSADPARTHCADSGW